MKGRQLGECVAHLTGRSRSPTFAPVSANHCQDWPGLFTRIPWLIHKNVINKPKALSTDSSVAYVQ